MKKKYQPLLILMSLALSILNAPFILASEINCSGSISVYANGCTFSKDGGVGRAKLYVNGSSSNLSDLIVYVTGFSVEGDATPAYVYEESPALFKSLSNGKNDILIVSYGEHSIQSIQKSGNALIEVFSDINEMKSNSLNKSTIVGYSMGGLVARYALLKAEYSKIEHGMSIYVSLDSPHKGSQSPVGLQYLTFATKNQLENLYDDLSDSDLVSKIASDKLVALEEAGSMLDETYARILDNEATQQMNIFNILDPNNIKQNALYEELASLGGMPIKTHNIGIANGTLNSHNNLKNQEGSLSTNDADINSTIHIKVDEKLVDKVASYTGQYKSNSSNIVNTEVASVSTRLPVQIQIKGTYIKCQRKKKHGIPYPSCGKHYGVIGSYTEVDHDFNISYPSPINFDADRWPGSTESIYPNVVAPFQEILSDLDFGGLASSITSVSTFIPTLSALNVTTFNPHAQTGLSLPTTTHDEVVNNSTFDTVVYSSSGNLWHGNHDLLFDGTIEKLILNNNDDTWLIPVITSMLL
jgi:hypothetical protein